MDTLILYPRKCRKGIRLLTDTVGMSADTAYGMMLMTAALMDMRPEDDRVCEMILADCGFETDIA